MEKYEIQNALGAGTYGVVSKAIQKQTGQEVALKRIKLDQEDEGIPSTTIREITLLRKLKHRNVIGLYEVIHVDRTLVLVFELLDCDLRQYLDEYSKKMNQRIGVPSELCESFTYQLLRGLAFCHERRVIHRDLKPQNLLINKQTGVLKIADFGLARGFGIPVKNFTNQVITLWYRSPDILMGSRKYSTPCDLWSVGCIFAETATSRPLFPGQDEHTELVVIFKKVGPPTRQNFPSATELGDWKPEYAHIKQQGDLRHELRVLSVEGMDLMERLLVFDPKRRITARRSLKHPYLARAHKIEQEKRRIKVQEIDV